MSPPASPATTDALLAHADWIRSLARSLVRDPDTADEITQRTLIAAWTRPPDRSSLRAWLAHCIRNFAHGARRTGARRARSEELAAQPEALPSAHDVVERASLSRELVEHVLALDEPYRTAILLRYFDEKQPSEIGRELGVPAATVRTRVARGLAQLRERLDRRHGERDTWSALLVPFLHENHPSALPFLLAMNASLKIGLPVAVGVLALAYFASRPGNPPHASEVARLGPSTSSEAALEPVPPALAPATAARERAAEPARPTRAPAASPPSPRAARGAHGRVLDVDGLPRADVRLTTSFSGPDGGAASNPAREHAVSTADGTFTIPGPLAPCRIRADDPELATVLAGVHGDSADENELVVVVATALAGEGSVSDEAGNPLERVHVYVDLPDDLRARFDVPLDRSLDVVCEARTDASGAFVLQGVPRIPDARLVAERDGYQRWSSRLDEIQGMPIAITLLSPGAKQREVAGRVVDASKQPLEGAHVALGWQTMRTESDGSFRFALDDANGRGTRHGFTARDLRAAYAGFLPGRYEPPLEGGQPQWPEYVELQLDAPTLAIEGKVLDHAGRARAGLKVWLADSTTFGGVGGQPVQLESLLAGEEKTMWRFVETDDDGRFRIDGLVERDYTLEAMEPETLLRAREEDVPAGTTQLVLRMPEEALFPRVAGVVRGHDGRGIEGAAIGPMCDAFRARTAQGVLGTSHDALRGVRTDAQGRFELTNVPKSLVYLRIDGEGILPLEYGRRVDGTAVSALPLETIESLDIVVDRRAHVQVELGDPAAADAFALLDETGGELELSAFSGSGRREGERQPIRGGRSDVVAGTDRGRSVVLFKDGLEVARLPITLVVGETTLVRF